MKNIKNATPVELINSKYLRGSEVLIAYSSPGKFHEEMRAEDALLDDFEARLAEVSKWDEVDLSPENLTVFLGFDPLY